MYKNSIINLFKSNPQVLIGWLSKYYPFPESLILKHKDRIDWGGLSSNKNIIWTEDFIFQFHKKFSWDTGMSKNRSLPWSVEFFNKYKSKFENKEHYSGNIGMPWSYDFINRFKNDWNWHYLAVNKSINWTEKMFVDFDMFGENLSNLNGENLWTEEFILKYKNRFNWAHLCYNHNLPWSDELIEILKSLWLPFERDSNSFSVSPWKGLSENKNLPWSKSFLKKHVSFPIIKSHGFYWNELSRNEYLPWDDNLLDDYSNKWNWDLISCNNGVGFTMEQIEKHKNKIKWKANMFDNKTIAINSSLPWSEYLIDKYYDKWHWWGLAMNKGVNWSDELIDKYSDKLDNFPLFNNHSLPWSLDFILKNENGCMNAWARNINNVSEVVWNKVFKSLLTDELVEELLSFQEI